VTVPYAFTRLDCGRRAFSMNWARNLAFSTRALPVGYGQPMPGPGRGVNIRCLDSPARYGDPRCKNPNPSAVKARTGFPSISQNDRKTSLKTCNQQPDFEGF